MDGPGDATALIFFVLEVGEAALVIAATDNGSWLGAASRRSASHPEESPTGHT